MDEPRFGGAYTLQVSRFLGITEDEAIARAIGLGEQYAPVRGWFEANAVDALTAGMEPRQPLHGAEILITEAFKLAREAEKLDWKSMAVPVLKNRLLTLTGGAFSEHEYGAPSLWSFVTKFPDLLTLEGTWRKERVRIREDVLPPEQSAVGLDPVAGGRLRPDLWRAAFDYSSGRTYIWDEARGIARPRREADAIAMPQVPTLDADRMAELRREFASLQSDIDEGARRLLDEWAARHNAPRVALPQPYRALWDAHLKSHAANLLRSFFVQQAIEVPPNLLLTEDLAAPHGHIEHLREMAHRYIDAMSADELSRLSIEVAVVARVSGSDRR